MPFVNPGGFSLVSTQVLQAPKGGHLELYPQGGKEITKVQMPSNTMVILDLN